MRPIFIVCTVEVYHVILALMLQYEFFHLGSLSNLFNLKIYKLSDLIIVTEILPNLSREGFG